MFRIFRYILLPILLLTSLDAFCLPEWDYKFRTLSPKGGFYYDLVKSTVQDRDGFMWVLMENDIQRFDGYTYKRYYPKFKEYLPEAGWAFGDIATDPGGNLYVSSNNGIFTYNRLTDSFDPVLELAPSYFTIDRHDNMWVNIASRVYRIDRQTLAIDTLTCDGRPVQGVRCSHPAGNGIYMGSGNGRVYRYDYGRKEFELFYRFPEGNLISEIAYGDGIVWVLTSDYGLFGINEASRKVVAHYEFRQPTGRVVPARDLLLDKNGTLWVATQAGIWVLCPATGESRRYQYSDKDLFTIPNNSAWSLSEDTLRNIWIGTFSGGLCMVALDEPEMFRTFIPALSGVNHNMISAFAEDGGNVWIGTEGGGVNRFERESLTFPYSLNAESHDLSVDNIKSLAVDPSGNVWIATFLGGLDRYNPSAGSFTNYRSGGSGANSILSNNLRKIVRDGDSGLWIIYQMYRSVVTYYSFAEKTFTHHYFDNKDTNYYLFDMVKGRGDDLWMVSSKNLYRFDTALNKAENILADTIPFLNAQSLAIDGKGDIWIGTIGHGIVRYRPSDGSVERSEKMLELNVSAVYSMIADDNDDIWMGTDNGLVKYDPAEDVYFRFDETDGLQGKVYYPLACMKASDGILFFGGTNGFSSIKPGNIRQNPNPPKAIISEFLLDNEPSNPVFRGSGGYETDEIVLPYSQTNFGFRFSSDNYVIPAKNTFRYRLVGYDNRWITTDALNRNVIFTRMPSGSFRFEIQAANNDGVWGPVTSVRITRRAAPWASVWAYVLYAAAAVAIVFMIVRFRREKQLLQLELYKDKLDKQQKEEIHQSQLRFFTNISHDFRTPLSLILGVVDNLRKEGVPESYYRMLRNNTQRLLNLVNELMDFRTLQHGKMQLQVGRTDINRLTESIASDFDELAARKGVEFVKRTDPALPADVYADRQVLEKIIMNLLNNSFKHTPQGGTVSVETYSDSTTFKGRYDTCYTVGDSALTGFGIAVRDTGVGISETSIGTVFDRYYNVTTANLDAHLGTGIGLALVKSLVLLHKGSITICSARDRGTDMFITLPSDPTVYTPDEFSSEPGDGQYVPGTIAEKAGREMIGEVRSGEKKNILLRDRKRILVVEDNNDLRRLMTDFLSPHYDVEQAANGWVASRYLEDHEVNMVITDIMMPVMDGIELCRQLKNDVNTSHIPVVMLTAKTGLDAKLEGAESGADIYFEKPVDFNLLLLTVRNLFDQQDKLRNYYSKNYFVESVELAANEKDNAFLKKLVDIIEANLTEPVIDVHLIASEMSMSRTKLYSKLKSLTGHSIVEFILNFRLRKAARLIIEQDLSIKEVMEKIGIKSQSYFTNVFKKEFGDTPAAFARKHNQGKKKQD